MRDSNTDELRSVRESLIDVLSEFYPRESLNPASPEDWERLGKVYQCTKERYPKLRELDLRLLSRSRRK